MAKVIKKANKNGDIRVSDNEREVLRGIIKSEKATLKVFSLPDKEEQTGYERILEKLDRKFS